MISDQVLLTIAGFDPSSGAGVTADLHVFAAHGFFGTACVTALTEQSTRGVRATHPVEREVLAGSLACLAEDLPPSGIKVGMLATAENVVAVAEFARTCPGVPMVVDPVLLSSSGAALLSGDGLWSLREQLLPVARWLTPNRAELGRLLEEAVETDVDVERAARRLRARFPNLGVVVTGGDGQTADDYVRPAGKEGVWLRGERVESRSTHGTGCAFSSALLCGLVSGMDGLAAASAAKAYVTEAIRRAQPRGAGRGPMALLWPLLQQE
jgi:hydroxymethylpyrimidine/phosphomethylpyrimidine kinase